MKLNERCVAEYSTSSAPIDKEGYLNKKGELNRGYQRRWFLLKGNLLYYFEKRSDKEPIGVIVLDNCHVELAESGEPYAFQISFGGDGSRTYILGADTAKDMEAWMRAITHSNYDCLKMMVESFESKLQKLTSEEIDLATASCSNSKANPTSIESVSGASDLVGINIKKYNLDSFEAVMARPISEQSIKPEDRDQWTVDCLFKQTSRLQSTLPVFLSSVSSPVNSPFCESSVLSFCSAHHLLRIVLRLQRWR